MDVTTEAVYRRTSLKKLSGLVKRSVIRTVALRIRTVSPLDPCCPLLASDCQFDSLCLLDAEMLFVKLLRREVVRDDLSLGTPRHVHLLEGQVIAASEDSPNIAGRPVRVDTALFDQEFVNRFSVA